MPNKTTNIGALRTDVEPLSSIKFHKLKRIPNKTTNIGALRTDVEPLSSINSGCWKVWIATIGRMLLFIVLGTWRRKYQFEYHGRREDENEVEEVGRPKPMGKDQAKRKMKAGPASSICSFDVEALAKMMASEYVMASDPYTVQKNQEMSELLKIKKQELKLKVAELEIRRMENRQRDEALYETTTDEALKERLWQSYVFNLSM
nr:hypothetical protein [Tanacetum cinerariifolium]